MKHSYKKANKNELNNKKLIDDSHTAIAEYLSTTQNEYQIELNRTDSIESKSGLIMTLLGGICIFLFDKIELKDIFSLMTNAVTFLDFFRIVDGLLVYTSFFFTLIMIIKTINIRLDFNLIIESIDEELVSEERIVALCRIIFTYRDIILRRQEINEKKANSFKKALSGIIVTFITIIIYITII